MSKGDGRDRAALVHVLKVTLRDVRPAVWRRLEVPSAATLGDLHEVLQVAFGWHDDHLHDFRVRGVRYTPREPDRFRLMLGEPPRDEDVTLLRQVAPRPGDVLDYTYDFGDDWQHRLVVESVGAARPDAVYPACTAGSGLPPEEDTGELRQGRFGEGTLRTINSTLRRIAVAGRDLPVDDAVPDPHFTGLFPDLIAAEEGTCPCGCGETFPASSQPPLPALKTGSQEELAALATTSPLVQRARALSAWVGSGRVLTPSQLLRPADAVRAVDELGLTVPVLPDNSSDDSSGDPSVEARAEPAAADVQGGREAKAAEPAQQVLSLFEGDGDAPTNRGPARRVRSAKDLPALHPLWTGCLAAGLIEVRAGKAYPGPGLATWEKPADPVAQLETWCALLGGYLRALHDAVRSARDVVSRTRAQVLQTEAPLLYAIAHQPVPVAALCLATAELDELDDFFGMPLSYRLPAVMGEVRRSLEAWALAGAVAPAVVPAQAAALLSEQLVAMRTEAEEQVALAAAGPAGPEQTAMLRDVLFSTIDALQGGPAVRLSPLGSYGLARLLEAHGWQIPRAGGCAGCAPEELLDQLGHYLPPDVDEEAAGWLRAQGENWEQALREVLWSAAAKDDNGPARRALLPSVLSAAGARVAPVLDAVDGDRWLTPILSVTRFTLGIGPPPSLADLLWLAVDLLSTTLDDPEGFAEELEDSTLAEMLVQPGAVAVAVGLDHPNARDVLQAAAPHVEDPQLSRALRKALAGRSGNPALRGGGARRKSSRGRRR